MKSHRILVVEDEERIGALIKEILELSGYSVTITHRPTQALAAVNQAEQPFHLLISDVVMPEMNGPELVRLVTAQMPTIRTLFISGYADSAVMHHQMVERGVPFLQKPFSISALSRKVAETIDQ